MKKTLLRFSLLLGATAVSLGTTQAQQAVPNGTLETWGTRNSTDVPAQWLTTDDVLQAGLPGFPATPAVTKSSDARGGSFAAKLTNTTTAFGDVPGFMVLGTAIGSLNNAGSNLEELGGLPYTSRPARMQLYYKFTGTINTPDSRPLAGVMLTKTTGGVRSIVARGRLYLPTTPGAAAAYTLANVPLTYTQNIAPDSMHIAFGSGDYNEDDFPAGNSLFVDDIVMMGTVSATRDPKLQAAVSVYPNPSATGVFTLAAPQDAALLDAPLTVTDALGRVVLQQAAGRIVGGSRAVDLRQRPAGVYALRLETARGPVVHQLVVQ